jgi:O-antigen/teichoic acid export membrane protein
MEHKRSYSLVYKNSVILTFLRLVEPGLAMVVIVAVSRVLGTEAMGGYAFIITFISMFSAIGQMGLQALLTREVAADREKSSSYLSAALLLGLGSSVILAFVMNGLKGYFNLSPAVSQGVFLMSLDLFPIFAIATFEAVFMGWERTDFILYQNISGNIVRVALSLLFIRLGFGLVSLVAAVIASTLFSVAVCAFTYARRLGALSFRVDLGVSLRLLRISPTFLLITVVAVLSARLDVLILTKLTDMTQVALYAAAYKLFEATLIVPQSYMRASFPHLSALFRSAPDAFSRANRDMLRHVLLYAFPTAAVTVALAPLLVSLLYGGKFATSAALLRVLAIGLIPWSMGRTTANILLATNLQKYDLLSGVFTVVTSIALNICMIPVYGAMGAALSSAAAWSVFFLCELYFSRRAGYGVALGRAFGRPLLAGAGVFAVAWVGMLGWVCASIEWACLAAAALFYFKNSRNRQKLARPFVLFQEIMKA